MEKFRVVKADTNLLVLKPNTKHITLRDVIVSVPTDNAIQHIRWLDGDFWIIEYYQQDSQELTTSYWDVVKEYERTQDLSRNYNPTKERFKFVATLLGVGVLAYAAFH